MPKTNYPGFHRRKTQLSHARPALVIDENTAKQIADFFMTYRRPAQATGKPHICRVMTNRDDLAKVYQAIHREFNGDNHAELALRWHWSESYIRWVLSHTQTDGSVDPVRQHQPG